MNMFYSGLIAILLVLLFSVNEYNYVNINKCSNIAHGCGLYNSIKYTNSLEALMNSYKKGYRYIEIDLLVTNDNHIVGAHDWKRFRYLTSCLNETEINYDYLLKAKILENNHIIYDTMIYNLLAKYKTLHIFTDKIKDYNLLKLYGRIMNRIHVEVFSYRQYELTKEIGFENVMLNVRSYDGIKRILLEKNNTIKGITINPFVFYSYKNDLKDLFKRNIKIYAYLIDNKTDIKSAYCKYVNGFYVD